MVRQALYALLVCVAACREPAPPPCPAGSESDPATVERLVRLLSGSARGRALLDDTRDRRPRLCFGPGDAAVWRTDGPLLLPRTGDDRERAANLGHLLRHVIDTEPELTPQDCPGYVDAMARFEDRGHAEELELQTDLDVDPTTRRNLTARIPPLLDAYRRRCEDSRGR